MKHGESKRWLIENNKLLTITTSGGTPLNENGVCSRVSDGVLGWWVGMWGFRVVGWNVGVWVGGLVTGVWGGGLVTGV